jgi:hypothetical protein
VNDALAEALAGDTGEATAGTGRSASGPPITAGEKEGLVVAVRECWNVGALSSEALRTTVTIYVRMTEAGLPEKASIKMVGYEGGSAEAAQRAFEAGSRAIQRCAKSGYPLPPEKYDQWREIEMTFDPVSMRIR